MCGCVCFCFHFSFSFPLQLVMLMQSISSGALPFSLKMTLHLPFSSLILNHAHARTRARAPGGEDPFLYIDHLENFHLLYHRMNDGQQTGGHAFSKTGKSKWTFGPPAYDASVRYENPEVGNVWFASRERPHLVFETRESDGVREIVALTTGVKVCDFANSTVQDCNSNAWPGYNDKSYTSVQPVRSSRSPARFLF